MNIDLENKPKRIPVGIPSFLNNIYRLLGYEDNSSYNSSDVKQQYSSALNELKKELVDANMLTVHFIDKGFNEIQADKTTEEMLDAIASGKNIVGYYQYGLYGDTIIMRPSSYNLESKTILFSGTNLTMKVLEQYLFSFYKTNSNIGVRFIWRFDN